MIKKDKKIIIALFSIFFLMLLTLFVEFLLPDKFQHDGTISKISTYKIYWSIVGILHVVFTLIAIGLLIKIFLKNSASKAYLYMKIFVLLCVAFMWLRLVLLPVLSFLNRYGDTTNIYIQNLN